MEKLGHPGKHPENGEDVEHVGESWRTSEPFSMDDFGATDAVMPDDHVSGTQLRRRLIDTDAMAAAAAQDPGPSLLQRMSRRLGKRS